MPEEWYEVFVYATLLGEYDRATPANLAGFERDDTGPNPTIVPGDGTVEGEVIRVDAEELAGLDRYEGYTPGDRKESLYVRLSTKGDIQVYVANAEQFPNAHVPIEEVERLIAVAEIELR